MRRVSISDIVQFTGLSRATVDRVMNGRGSVHPRTREVVEEALKALKAPHVSPKGMLCDLVLRVGRGMTAQMKMAWDKAPIRGEFHDMYDATEAELLDVIAKLCADLSRPLIITAKNTPRLVEVLQNARGRGKRIVTLVSDLAVNARDCFVGIDNRAAGQTAAFLIGRTIGDRPSTAAVVVGDIAFRCHEDREIGFRTGLRANFPKVVLSGEASGEDSPSITRDAALRLLRDQPALGAIYNVGGGNKGLVDAIRESGRSQDLLLITVPLLREGQIDFTLAGNPEDQLYEAIRLASLERLEGIRDVISLDFSVFTRFNLPSFSQ